jgi:hypothetical protein
MIAVVAAAADTNRIVRYARCLKASKRAEWHLDRDLLQDRSLDFSRKFLPDGLSLIGRLDFLAAEDARFLSQLQGRTYAYMVGLVERFISAKMLEQARTHVLGDQSALEGLVRFSAEELKHQELFRRLDEMMAAHMPPGYIMTAEPNHVAAAVLAASTWAVLALTCHIELFVQAHYEQSIAPREELCPLFKDVFRFHWRDECQHVMLDELEWTAEHERLSPAQRDHAVDQLISLIAAMDSILTAQSKADAAYFIRHAKESFTISRQAQIESALFAAYRWQYIVSGVKHVHFNRLLTNMTNEAQQARIGEALRPILRA